MEIVDHRMVGSLRVDLLDRARSGAVDGVGAAFQTSTIEALLDGAYEGDLTIGEILAHGDLGIGTLDHLDGELIVVDGTAFVATADGALRAVPDGVGTPFAVVCPFEPGPPIALPPCGDLRALTAAVDAVAPAAPVLAVRIDGRFGRVVVRSVARQEPPYPPLREVVAHQREWVLSDLTGTLVGFRFPDTTGGLEVPGWHLHVVDDARTAGGHVMDVAVETATLRAVATDDLHVEVPSSIGRIDLGAGPDRRSEIDVVEGHGRPP